MPRLKSPKAKGDKYERELAKYFNEKLFNGEERVARAPLSGGGYVSFASGGGADLTGLPLWFVEAKAVEKLNVRSALAQVEGNVIKRESPDTPVVINKINREAIEDSVVSLRLKDFVALLEIQLRLGGYAEHDERDDKKAIPFNMTDYICGHP